jgi:thioredoxin-like negative regulator of GroEL
MLAAPIPPAVIEEQTPEPLGVLLARGRQARELGRMAEAIRAYDAMLAQVPDHETALLERAETLGWAGQYAASREGYQAFRKLYPARALTAELALARLAAWQDHTAEALAFLDPWVKQEQRQAILDAATYLSWNGRLSESLARVRRWLVAHPEDRQATLLEARVLSWAGRHAEARAAFHRVLSSAKTDREALAGLAQLALWEGDTREARRILDRMPPEALSHPDSQVMLARVEQAEGQTRSGFRRAQTQATGGTAQRDAEEVRDDLVRAFGPWVELSSSQTDTSEGLRTENPVIRVRVPLGDGALSLGESIHRSDFQGVNRQPAESTIGLNYPLGLGINASGSLSRVSNAGGEPAWGYALGLGYTPLPGLDLSLTRERSVALFTPQAATLRTIFVTTDFGATWRFGQGRHALSAGLGEAEVTSNPGGSAMDSTRHSHFASYEYRFPVTAIDVRGGLLTRDFGYSQTLPLGFFNPENYRWNGAFGSATWRRGRVFEAALGAQAGSQTVNGGPGQFTWSYRVGLTWSPQRWPIDLSAWWTQSLAGLPLTTPLDPSAYREHTLGMAIKIRGKKWIW